MTDALSVAVPEYPSVAVVVQVTVSPGLAIEASSVRLAAVPTRAEPTNHAYDTVGVSPSASAAVPVHVKVVDVSTPVVGLIEAVMVGFRLSTVTVAPFVSLPPSASVAVAAHWILSVGDAVVLLSVSLSLVPNDEDVDAFVHS